MRYESLIFDIDGTLWDSRALVAEGYNIQLEKEGLSHLAVNAEMFIPLFGKVMTEIADIIFPSIPAPERYALMERCMDTENKHLRENECRIGYPGIRETMEKLAKKVPLFIVSNCQKGYIELVLKWADLGPVVQDYLCFGDTGTSKGQTILTLMKRNNLKKSIYVGDVQGDADACKEAGIPIIYCKYGFGTIEEPYAVIGEFKELDAMF